VRDRCTVRCRSEEPEAHSEGGGTGAGRGAQLAVGIGQVPAHGRGADAEADRDLPVVAAVGDQPQDLELPPAQARPCSQIWRVGREETIDGVEDRLRLAAIRQVIDAVEQVQLGVREALGQVDAEPVIDLAITPPMEDQDRCRDGRQEVANIRGREPRPQSPSTNRYSPLTTSDGCPHG